MAEFPEPMEESVFYEDEKLYACLGFHKNHVEGKTIIAWKKDIEDLNDLSQEDYQHLMEIVWAVRKALMKAYDTKKVYLAYLDETRHVYWHLFPRKQGGIEGFDLMTLPQEDTPKEDLEMVSSLRSLTIENLGTK